MPSKGAAVQDIIARPGPACAASLGIRVLVAAIAILGASIGSASAQDWPTRPIRLVVGASAGGGTDISARLIAQPLAEILGQAVVVENRAGAAGTTAAEAVAKSPKDGYTAYMMSNAHAISAVMYKALRYDPINDFQMVSMVASRSCGRARLSRSRSRGRAGCGARQSWKIQFRQRRRRYDPAFCRRADEADRRP